MARINVKKDKKKVNDGGHSPLGVDLDPNKNLTHVTNPDGSTEAYYKDSEMDYNDYIDELQDRTERSSKGKDFTSKSIGYFSGFSFPKDEKKK